MNNIIKRDKSWRIININNSLKDYSKNIWNNYAGKYKTTEERKFIANKYIEHIRNWYPKHTFPFCGPKTIKKYIINYPDDFPILKIEEAERIWRLFWERILMKYCLWIIECNPKSIIFILKNKYPQDYRY